MVSCRVCGLEIENKLESKDNSLCLHCIGWNNAVKHAINLLKSNNCGSYYIELLERQCIK